MKKRQALFLSAVLPLALFIAALGFQAHRLLPSEKLHELLIQRIVALTEGSLKYQNVRVDYFPQPRVVFEHAQLTFPDRPLTVEAHKIQFDFDILPLFIARVEPSAFYVKAGKIDFSLPGMDFLNPVRFENFSLQVGAVRPRIPIPFHFITDMAGKPSALVMKGNIVLDSVDQWNWEKASGSMVAELKGLSLDGAAKGIAPNKQGAFALKAGQVDTSVEIRKKAQEVFLELTAIGSGKGLAYEALQEKTWVTPPAFDAEWNVTAGWNHDTGELKLHKAFLKLPFAGFEMNGGIKFNTGEISGLHVASSNMALEDLLKYWPGIESALPFHIGFSGHGKWVLSMEGTVDHLSLHFGWDLSQALLSYGQYFTKPKDVPLDLSFDFLLQKGATLGGDFAVKFKELSMKGNLKDLSLKTGEGQLNLITNKFPMNGWEQYIPVLQGYKLEGDVKLMANWKGDLRELEKAEHIFNITLDKASWTVPISFDRSEAQIGAVPTAVPEKKEKAGMVPEGPGIRNVSLSLDASPLMLEGRQMRFEIGGLPVTADLKISGFSEKTDVTVRVSAAELKPLEVCETVAALLRPKGEESLKSMLDQAKEFIQAVFPKDETIKNLATEILYHGEAWNVPTLKFESYGGKADLKGWLNFKDKGPAYHLEGQFLGVDLGSFLGRQDATQPSLLGSLDLKGSVDGNGWGQTFSGSSLVGQGEMTLVSGGFTTFDLKDVLSAIEPFKDLGSIRPSLKDFDSMNFAWKISEGKVATANLLVKSKDYVMDGEGTLGLDGLANFRSSIFLSGELASELLPDMRSSFQKNPQAHWGPIAVLFAGSLLAPEVKCDPVQGEELTGKIREGKAKDLLYELVTE